MFFCFFLCSLAALKNMTERSVCNSADNIAKETFRASGAGKRFVESPLKQKAPTKLESSVVVSFFSSSSFLPLLQVSERKRTAGYSDLSMKTSWRGFGENT